MYLQRNRHKQRFGEIAPDSWFLRERLTDKIAFSIPWSVLEPREGEFAWKHPDWEGCIDSWVAAGFKVALQVRGMGTLGTCYDDGTPQWVFDAGARRVDEEIAAYRGTHLLNDIPEHSTAPIRYPVYWDEVYLDKVRNLVRALGTRYNGRPEIEYISIGHLGRWGEMHIAHHSPLQPWREAGLSITNYCSAYRSIMDFYRASFPDTELSQEIGTIAFGERPGDRDLYDFREFAELFGYAADRAVILKFDGVGKSYHSRRSDYLDDAVTEILNYYKHRTKIAFENLVLPEAEEEALALGMSYWHRGGETEGLGAARVEWPVPLERKRLYSFYSFFRERYDRLLPEDEKNLWRLPALKCGYRLEITEVCSDGEATAIRLRNNSFAPFREAAAVVTIAFAGRRHRVALEGLEAGEEVVVSSPWGSNPAKVAVEITCRRGRINLAVQIPGTR